MCLSWQIENPQEEPWEDDAEDIEDEAVELEIDRFMEDER